MNRFLKAEQETMEDYLNQGKIIINLPEDLRKQPYPDVQFSVYTTKRNLVSMNRVPIKGKLIIECSANEFFGGTESKLYRSRILKNASWQELMDIATEQMRCTNDRNHYFLEGIEFSRMENGVKICELMMGS